MNISKPVLVLVALWVLVAIMGVYFWGYSSGASTVKESITVTVEKPHVVRFIGGGGYTYELMSDGTERRR
jgi:uncharacterized protein (UPF0333 family)